MDVVYVLTSTCDRDRSSLMFSYLQGLSTGKVLTKWVNIVLESADYIASSKDTQKGDVN